jgi:hypothetical protein
MELLRQNFRPENDEVVQLRNGKKNSIPVAINCELGYYITLLK